MCHIRFASHSSYLLSLLLFLSLTNHLLSLTQVAQPLSRIKPTIILLFISHRIPLSLSPSFALISDLLFLLKKAQASPTSLTFLDAHNRLSLSRNRLSTLLDVNPSLLCWVHESEEMGTFTKRVRSFLQRKQWWGYSVKHFMFGVKLLIIQVVLLLLLAYHSGENWILFCILVFLKLIDLIWTTMYEIMHSDDFFFFHIDL